MISLLVKQDSRLLWNPKIDYLLPFPWAKWIHLTFSKPHFLKMCFSIVHASEITLPNGIFPLFFSTYNSACHSHILNSSYHSNFRCDE